MRFGKVTRSFTAGLMVFSMVSFSPVLALAGNTTITTTSDSNSQLVTTLKFATSSDSTLITGEVSTVNIQLYDQFNQPFSGNLTADLTAADGTVKTYPVSGSNGNYSVTGVNPLAAGSYTLTIKEGFNQFGKVYTVEGTITVLNSVAKATGSLVLNNSSLIKVTLTDSNGNPLAGKAITVDASAVVAGNQNLTTLSDGTCNFSITPTQMGTIYFQHGGLVVGSLAVAGGAGSTVKTSGSLVLNAPSLVTGTLLGSDGNPLTKTTVTLDESGIAGSSQTYTTLNDGTFSIAMTPTRLGTVNFLYGGNIVGSMIVQPTYAANPRIGASSSDNPSMSVAVAQKGWTGAQNVILTRQDVLVDAMTAIPLSKKLDAPILMTDSNSLPAAVLTEIQSLKATNVYIIGGVGAVSAAVEGALTSQGLSITRVSGTDRYDTAAQIAKLLGPAPAAYLAYGYGEPDAIVGSVFAAEQGYPVLLTDSSTLPAPTQTYLTGAGTKEISILGGEGVVTPALATSLANNYSVTRLGGSDRYYTEQAVCENFFTAKPVSDQYPVFFASSSVSPNDVGGGTPDASALLAGALAAKQNGLLMVVPSNTLPDGVNNFLLYNKVYIPQSTVVGNVNAVSGALETQLEAVLSR
ncbi:MAG: cell wall-binding repeat-containing protein [Desulfosporosinus sp.]|nr:cell wall-binding repeat-containing protein [Desulfosporosinus sp.]